MSEPRAPGPTRTSLDATRRLAPGSLLAGRYRILEFLGLGGMGMVYRARDEQLELEVAIKVLRPELAQQPSFQERFRREIILARQVTHRHVVRIHDLGRDGELCFLSMDFVAGESLRKLLDREGKLPPERAVAIARQLAEAIGAAHAEGIVHRDLKPSNVMIDGAGRAYITDFGIARSLATSGVTRTGTVLGTLDYVSPEQARGEEIDARSDLYSLGVILFEMLSGELPFAGETAAEALAQRISGSPRDLDEAGVEAPPGLRAIVRRCLERNPARRYAGAADLLAALAAGDRPHRIWGRGKLAAAALALAAAVLMAAVAAVVRWGADRAASEGDAAGGSAPATGRALAVLPFVDETGLPDLAWTAKGLAEMLAEDLATSPGLRVVDSVRVFRTLDDLKFAVGPWAPPALTGFAELFDVDRFVVGRVRTTAGKLRLDTQLYTLAPPAEPVAAALEPASGDPQALADLVRALAARIRAALAVPGPHRPEPTSASLAALRAYAEGVEALSRGDFVVAEPALARAVEADPAFAAAWIRLADARAGLGHDEPAREAAERAVAALGAGGGRLALEARARQAQLGGQPEAAQRILGELAKQYSQDGEILVRLAESYGEAGELPQAAATLERVVARDANHPRAWFLLAKYSILSGESRRAVDEFLVRALVIQNKLRNEPGKAEVLNAYGVAYSELGELSLARDHYRQAAEIRQRVGDRRGYATTLRNLGQIEMFRGDHAAAEQSLDRALEMLEELGDRAGTAGLHNDLGLLEEQRGRYPRALERYRQALHLRQQLGDQRAVAESFNNVGYAYFLLGEYDNAMVYWQQSLALHRKTGNEEGVLLATQSIGQLQLAQGDWTGAAKSLLAALETARRGEPGAAAAVSLGYLGQLAHFEGRFQAALSSYDEALSILRRIEDPRGLAEFTLGRAATLLELGRTDATAEELAAVAGWLAEGGSDEQRAELERLRAEVLLRRLERAAARAAVEDALAAAEASHSAPLILRVRLTGALLELESEGDGRAAPALREILADAARLGHAPVRLAATELLARAELASGGFAAAEQAAREGLLLAARCGAYGGAFRLHLLLARALQARGAREAAADEIERGLAELARLRGDLAPRERLAFDALAEVRELESQAARAGREVEVGSA